MPRPGQTLAVGRAASVQFTQPIIVRGIRVHDWSTYQGWVWLDVYELDEAGHAVDRRTIFVQPGGLRPVPAARHPAADRGSRLPGRTPRATARAPPADRILRSPPSDTTGCEKDMTATVAIDVPGVAASTDEPDDPFRLDVRIVKDTRRADQAACATNNGCVATCSSACAGAP